MINQVTIIIVTKVNTADSCIVVSLGESDHQLIYHNSYEDESLSMYKILKRAKLASQNNQNMGDFYISTRVARACSRLCR